MRIHPALIRTVPFVIAFALTACSGESQSPTAPEFEKSLAPAAAASVEEGSTVAASEQAGDPGALAEAGSEKGKPAKPPKPPKPPTPPDNGNGNGGNGNGNGGGGNENRGQGELRVELQPATWNTNWENSQGTVSALIRGSDLGDIDPATIELIGTDGAEAPLPAERVQSAGNHLRAFFRMADAIDTLDTPTRGETHIVTIRFTADGETVELTAQVRIVGPAGGNDDEEDDEEEALSLAIQPDVWNTNWARSTGTVSFLLRGSDLDSIVEASIFLVGSDPAAAPLAPVRVQRAGNHVRAFFAKAAALATLDTPAAGEIHEIELQFTDASGAVVLVDTVRIVGPAI